jgi:diadenylate cyclase
VARSQPDRTPEEAKAEGTNPPAPADEPVLPSAAPPPRKRADRKAKFALAKPKAPKEAVETLPSAAPPAELTRSMIAAAAHVAKEVGATSILMYVDDIARLEGVSRLLEEGASLILAAKDEQEVEWAKRFTSRILSVPPVNLTRMGQIKMATLMAFSQRMLAAREVLVCLVGIAGRGVDTIVVMNVGEEYEMLRTIDQPEITEHIRRAVFQRVLALAIQLASEGREGKPVGALFVIGDHEEVQKYCHQTIINPFKGYPESERNILDENMRETVREFCSIDGAFIISGKGTIMSAGTTLLTAVSGQELPQGLGSRHAAAAAITAGTMSVAITISESTGTVRVWRRGQMITEIEKAVPAPSRTTGVTLTSPHEE